MIAVEKCLTLPCRPTISVNQSTILKGLANFLEKILLIFFQSPLVLCLQYHCFRPGMSNLFHNGPNYKFKYIRRAANLLVYKISFF